VASQLGLPADSLVHHTVPPLASAMCKKDVSVRVVCNNSRILGSAETFVEMFFF
jgi:hypothetical protein